MNRRRLGKVNSPAYLLNLIEMVGLGGLANAPTRPYQGL